MSYIGKITTGGSTYHVGSTLYGTCDTAAGTAIKVAVVEGFDTLETGVTVHIKFTNSNTASNPSLEIRPSSTSGQQASHAIFVDETRRPGTTAFTSWFSGSVVSFTYDGSYWRMNDYIPNTDTNDAVTQTATDSTNATYEFLFSNTADNTTRTEGARKTQYLTFNPSKKALTVGSRASGSAVGDYSLGIGESVTASAINSFAIGNNASAQSNYGVAIGLGSKSRHRSQFVFGEYNIMDNKAGVTIPIDRGNYIEVVGNGTSSVRSNARTLDWDGNEWLAGSLVASSVSAVDSNSNTNTSISPTGLATYTIPSGSQAISTGLYTTSDDIVLYSGTVTNTWDGTNTSLKSAIAGKLSRAGGSVTGSVVADGSGIYLGSNTGRFAGLYTDDINCSGWIGGNIIRCGTKVVTATATNYLKVFTNAELNTLFNTTGCSNGNCVVFAMNGDSAQKKYMSGTLYENGNWYIRTIDGSKLTAGNFRVNYICIKFNV